MSRNGSGVQSTPSTFTAGTTITAADHNENWSDVASEITNSVAADGQTNMTGALKASNGSVSLPAVSFASDADSGMYRIGADNLGVAVNATKILDVATTGLTVVGDLSGTSVKQGGFALLPVGLGPLPWSGTVAPSLWLLCNGPTLLRASYPALWTFAEAEIALGNVLFTNGNGTTTFTICDMRDRVPVGKSGGIISSTHYGGNNPATLGAPGGDDGTGLSQANLPASVNLAGSTTGSLTYTKPDVSTVGATAGAGGGATNLWQGGNINAAGATTGSLNISLSLGGSGTEISRIQPSIITNYIIFAGV